MHQDAPPDHERLASIIVDSGLRVHRALGPGLLESAYEHCLTHELRTRGLAVECQTALPIIYDGTTLDAGYRVDLIIEQAIIVEVKAVEALTPVHHAQILTYLKLSRCRIGFLMNFHVPLFKHGLKRMVL
jgi:GxxExxY protein